MRRYVVACYGALAGEPAHRVGAGWAAGPAAHPAGCAQYECSRPGSPKPPTSTGGVKST
jgi:hypothetical protein